MSFNSLEFLPALLSFLLIYHSIKPQWRSHALGLFSVFFIGLWHWSFSLVVIALTTFVFLATLKMQLLKEDAQKKTRLFIFSASLLILVLVFYKYAGFVVSFLSDRSLTLRILFPIGLSYYSFKLVGYIAECYFDQNKIESNWFRLLAYSSFFPQVVCGPIQRSSDFLDQLRQRENDPNLISSRTLAVGVQLILFGFFKKLVIADNLGLVVDHIYANMQNAEYNLLGIPLVVASYAFTVQLYYDFSGLTDISIGISRLLNIRSPENFNNPFIAKNIPDFWRRWHITLSSWLTDYVYMPLNFHLRTWGISGNLFSIFVTFLLIGIWHGSQLNFLIFGTIHGIYMVFSLLTIKSRNRFFKEHPSLQPIRKWSAPFITFSLFTISLLFFRLDVNDALFVINHAAVGWGDFLRQISHLGQGAGILGKEGIGLEKHLCFVTFAAILFGETIHFYREHLLVYWNKTALRWAGFIFLILMIILFGNYQTNTFIYRNF